MVIFIRGRVISFSLISDFFSGDEMDLFIEEGSRDMGIKSVSKIHPVIRGRLKSEDDVMGIKFFREDDKFIDKDVEARGRIINDERVNSFS